MRTGPERSTEPPKWTAGTVGKKKEGSFFHLSVATFSTAIKALCRKTFDRSVALRKWVVRSGVEGARGVRGRRAEYLTL